MPTCPAILSSDLSTIAQRATVEALAKVETIPRLKLPRVFGPRNDQAVVIANRPLSEAIPFIVIPGNEATLTFVIPGEDPESIRSKIPGLHGT